MSNDEFKTSLVNYNRFDIDQIKANSNSSSSNGININKNNNNIKIKHEHRTVFLAQQSDKNSITATTPAYHKLAYQTDDVNNNSNNNNNIIATKSKKNSNKHIIDSHFVPMNLLTNTGLDLSHSTRKPYSAYLRNESYNYANASASYASSSFSSTSASIDVENIDNDDSGDRIMSPVSIPSHQRKPIALDTCHSSQSAFTNMELTAGSIASGFPLNYQQLYANNAALYGAPVMFSGAIHAAHASYMAGLPLHAALSPNDSYLKVIQAAACGIYSPTALAPPHPPPPAPPLPTSSVNPPLISCKPPTLHNSSGSIAALAPSQPPVGIPKSPHHQQYSPNIPNNNISEVEQQKKDYHIPPLNSQTLSQTATRFGSSSSSSSSSSSGSGSTGTYLNDKVNERLTNVDAAKDSHFKVPNGKEGSLKHRILRPPSNSDCPTELNKTPIMRTYSTSSNFKKGNYIELANGALRRVEDMRTEDFIQCAERSPHHQLAESTVVKINTNLPSTAVITFSYDRNRSKVDMEVSLDHPFFVYGQGWASCNPELSMKMFGLKCQRLQVGDICISLIKREPTRQPTSPVQHTSQVTLPQINESLNYQRRHSFTVSSPNATIKSSSLPTNSVPAEMPYPSVVNAHAFSIPVPASSHLHLQHHQQQHHQIQQQQQLTYAEMAKLMSSYAYAKGLPQLSHEQLKEAVMDGAMLQNLPPKMLNTFYQNQIFHFAQQQEHLRQTELQTSQQRAQSTSSTSTVPSTHFSISSLCSHSPKPTDRDINLHSQPQQPPQTQPLDVTMSRKRRWSAPENMFDDDDAATQPPRNGSSPAAART